MAQQKTKSTRGLQAKHADEPCSRGSGRWGKGQDYPPGFYMWAFYEGRWHAWLPLRFERLIDAEIGAAALVAAGIDTARKLHEAGAERVKEIACDALQW